MNSLIVPKIYKRGFWAFSTFIQSQKKSQKAKKGCGESLIAPKNGKGCGMKRISSWPT